tara:strand:+ start:1260 stop:1484 length:225 start_codon:yes stop_codon:yes gene_type:complete
MNYTQQELPRYELAKLDITDINIEIGAYQKVIEHYEDYLLRKGEDKYIQERIDYLYGQLGEYMIAREINMEKTV